MAKETGAQRLAQINLDVDNDAALIFQHHLVDGGIPLTIRSGANEITWGYSLLTKVTPTYGGEVQQILGTRIEEMTINGNTRDNNQLEQIYEWFRAYMTVASGFGYQNDDLSRSEVPITFSYPARKWQFEIQVTSADGFAIGTGLVATTWQIKAIVVPNGENKPHILEKISHDRMTNVLLPKGGIPVGIGYIAQNPYSDANYGGDDVVDLSHKIGDNFHRMLGAWSVGDFSHFVGDHSLPPSYNGLNQEAKEYYTKLFGSPFVAGSAAGTGLKQVNPADPGTTGGTSGTSTAVSSNQSLFANRLAALTKWDFAFICTWCLREESKKDKVPAVGARHTPDGDYNFLNVGQADSGPTSFAASANFLPDPVTAANFTFDWIQHHSASTIRAMLTSLPGKSAEECLVVLAASGWATSPTYLSGLQDIYRNQVKPNTQIASATTTTTGPGGQVANTFVGSPVPGQPFHSPTHQTAGLAGYPAYDYMTKAGTPCVSPIDGKIARCSGHDPSNGPTDGPHGPFGWSVYVEGGGKSYFLTHMGSRTVKEGDTVKQGQQIGTVGDYAKWGGADHIHQGVHG